MAQESTATGTDQSGVAAESRRSGSSLSPAAVPTFDVPNRLADERSDLHTTYSSATLEERTSHPRPTYVYRHESSPLPPSANRTIAQDIYTYAVRQLLEHSSINDTGQHYPNTTTSSSGSASLHRPRTVPSRMISSDQQHRSRPSTLLSGAVPLRRPRDMLSAGARPSHQAQQSSHRLQDVRSLRESNIRIPPTEDYAPPSTMRSGSVDIQALRLHREAASLPDSFPHQPGLPSNTSHTNNVHVHPTSSDRLQQTDDHGQRPDTTRDGIYETSGLSTNASQSGSSQFLTRTVDLPIIFSESHTEPVERMPSVSDGSSQAAPSLALESLRDLGPSRQVPTQEQIDQVAASMEAIYQLGASYRPATVIQDPERWPPIMNAELPPKCCKTSEVNLSASLQWQWQKDLLEDKVDRDGVLIKRSSQKKKEPTVPLLAHHNVQHSFSSKPSTHVYGCR